jgi:glyoxylase I family protein
MRVQGFHHLAIQVSDLERLAIFYREVLGLPELTRHYRDDGSLRSIWMGVGEGRFIALEHVDRPPEPEDFRDPHPGLFLFALKISAQDRPGIVRELTERKIEIVHQTRWTLYIRDPEGNRVALSHHPD